MNIEQLRADFEAWYRHHHGDRDVYALDEFGEYADKWVQGAFNVWQARAALQSQDREDAVEVMEILDTGEWSLVRSIPGEWLTDEANNEHRWCVQRQLPPYCGKDGVHYWTGPTAISALRAGMKAIDHARRVEEEGK